MKRRAVLLGGAALVLSGAAAPAEAARRLIGSYSGTAMISGLPVPVPFSLRVTKDRPNGALRDLRITLKAANERFPGLPATYDPATRTGTAGTLPGGPATVTVEFEVTPDKKTVTGSFRASAPGREVSGEFVARRR